jgi:hypothetical protein
MKALIRRFPAVFGGIDPAGGGGLGKVPPGRWKLAGGKTAPAVAAPGDGLERGRVLKGRRKWEVHPFSAALPGQSSMEGRSGGVADALPPANFPGSSRARQKPVPQPSHSTENSEEHKINLWQYRAAGRRPPRQAGRPTLQTAQSPSCKRFSGRRFQKSFPCPLNLPS